MIILIFDIKQCPNIYLIWNYVGTLLGTRETYKKTSYPFIIINYFTLEKCNKFISTKVPFKLIPSLLNESSLHVSKKIIIDALIYTHLTYITGTLGLRSFSVYTDSNPRHTRVPIKSLTAPFIIRSPNRGIKYA